MLCNTAFERHFAALKRTQNLTPGLDNLHELGLKTGKDFLKRTAHPNLNK